MIIPFAEWTPDLPEFMNLGMTATAPNCIPQPGGYAPFKDLSPNTDALNKLALGAISVKNLNGDAETFAGTSTKLYRLTGTTWNDITNTGGAYSLGSEQHWDFAQFGTRIVGVAEAENPQSYIIGTSSQFSDLGGSPPKFTTIAVVRDILVGGGVSTQQNRVQWSDTNDPTEWSTGQSGNQDIPEGGAVIRVIGGEVGTVFQEAAITRMTYVGPDLIFDFDQIHKNIGMQAARGAVRLGGAIFFLGTDGFYQLVINTGELTPIGHSKVDKTILGDMDTNSLHLVSAAYDTNLKIVAWAYPALVNNGFPNRLAIYHYPSGNWSLIDINTDMVFSHLTEGATLDGLDSAGFSDMDTATGFPSLDSSIFKGGDRVLAGIDTAHKLGTFEGDTLAATLQTGEFEGMQGMRSYINNVRPLIDASSINGTIRSRERLADSLSDSAQGSLNTQGYVPVDSNSARYHRVQLTVPASTLWNFAQGVELNPKQAGRY